MRFILRARIFPARRGRSPRGFSLVEMLVVVAIIAILAALLMPGLQGALTSARQVSCANNLKQAGVWGLQYASDWSGFLPHNGEYWVGDYRGYNNSSVSSWFTKNPVWQSNQRAGTVLHCPQESAVAAPYTSETWNLAAFTNTYALNLNLGGASTTANPDRPPRTNQLSSRKFWFCDGGGVLRADGRYAYYHMVNLKAWSGYNGKYQPFPFFFQLPFHSGQAANFLFGDGHLTSLPYAGYLGMTAAEKTVFGGG